MIKKSLQVLAILLFAAFSFFYTDKASQIIRNNDPIMVKIKEQKDNIDVSYIDPIIYNDEYVFGSNGCEIDEKKSYEKMKAYGEYNENLLVMKSIDFSSLQKNKYIISGNKIDKNVSIAFIIDDDININLLGYLNSKKIISNFFVTGNYLDNNIDELRNISKSHSVYYYDEYTDKKIKYYSNLINSELNNKSKYCLLNERNDDILQLCQKNNLLTIKSEFLEKNMFNKIQKKLSNGSIIIIKSDDLNEIKLSINYIKSKGYNFVSLDELLDNDSKCE